VGTGCRRLQPRSACGGGRGETEGRKRLRVCKGFAPSRSEGLNTHAGISRRMRLSMLAARGF
jgi:hypothetical protein